MKIHKREDWGWDGNLGPGFSFPVSNIVVHHSVTPQSMGFKRAMRLLNRIGHQRFGRFSYQYCIHRSGKIGEGAGDTIGAHTANFNSKAIGICFIGNYQHAKLTKAQIEAFDRLRDWLLRTGRLTRGHSVLPHRKFSSTACPGNDVIGKWSRLIEGSRAPDTFTPQPRVNPTVERTRQVQRLVGVTDDGIIGPVTRRAFSDHLVGWPWYVRHVNGRVPDLRGNSNHDLVAWVQRQGVRKGAYPRRMIDGLVGPRTNHVIVKALRQKDGICGPKGFTNACR